MPNDIDAAPRQARVDSAPAGSPLTPPAMLELAKLRAPRDRWPIPEGYPCAICDVVEPRSERPKGPHPILGWIRLADGPAAICWTCRTMWGSIDNRFTIGELREMLRESESDWFTRDLYEAPAEWNSDWHRGYLTTPAWRRRRAAACEAADYLCEGCGRAGLSLQVHHLTYDRLGHEYPEDLMALCDLCHAEAHHLLDKERDGEIRGTGEPDPTQEEAYAGDRDVDPDAGGRVARGRALQLLRAPVADGRTGKAGVASPTGDGAGNAAGGTALPRHARGRHSAKDSQLGLFGEGG